MNEFFQCSVCFENYDTKIRIPRLLPCQHSFCSSCLPKLLTTANSNNSRYYDYYVYRNTKDYIECPICRTKHYTKVDDIPKSRLILNLIELTQGNQNNITELLSSQSQTKKSADVKPLDSTTSSSSSTTTTPRLTPKAQNSNSPYITTYTPSNQYDRQTSTPINHLPRQSVPVPTAMRQQSAPVSYVQTQAYRSNSRHQSPAHVTQHYEPAQRQTTCQNPTTYYHHYQPQQQHQQQQPNYVRLNNVTSSTSSANLRQIRIQERSPSRSTTRNEHFVTPNIPSSTPRCNINRSQSLYNRSNEGSQGIYCMSSKRHNNNIHHNTPEWNFKEYLRELFDNMDSNKDGGLCFDELQEALKHGQLNSEFNVKTVQLLFDKYDTNGDGEIDFDDFHDLYTDLNNEYCTFLAMDRDGSGTLDADELCESFSNRGFKFKIDFFKFIEDTMRETNKNGITFDNYCRLIARFDYLNNLYLTTPRYQTNYTLETYLKKTFFFNFW